LVDLDAAVWLHAASKVSDASNTVAANGWAIKRMSMAQFSCLKFGPYLEARWLCQG
jgi:hypothetical protein